MQALRRVFGVQPSSEFHDHGLRLLIPDLSDTGELRGTPTTELVCFDIVNILQRTDWFGYIASSLSMG